MDSVVFREKIGGGNVMEEPKNKRGPTATDFESGAHSKKAKVDHEYDPIVNGIGDITESEYEKFAALVPGRIEQPTLAFIAHSTSETYKIVYFDLETTCRSTRDAEICQISAITDDGQKFMTFVLPEGDMDWQASMTNKITIEENNGERKLYKEGTYVESVDIELAIDMFMKYLEGITSVGKQKPPSVLVLLAHNGANFDVPILLQIGGTTLVERLSAMNIHFGDTMPLLRTIKEDHPLLQPLPGERSTSLMQTNVYQRLFNEEYRAHDALEDVLALRRIITSNELAITIEYLINNSKVISVKNSKMELDYREKKNSLEDTFYHKLCTPWKRANSPITAGMTKKIAEAGLSYNDLLKLYQKFGKIGVVGILTMPNLPSEKPRVTKDKRVLNNIIKYFQSRYDKENDDTNSTN